MAKEKAKRTLFHKIVNGFILFAGGLVFLLLILFSFSQTSTFRNYFKSELTAYVNSQINGKLIIGSLDGSIFTSLIIRDAELSADLLTVARVRKIEVQFSPLQVLINKLVFRKIKISDFDFRLLQSSDGTWNIENLIPVDSTSIEEIPAISEQLSKKKEDFPFLIQVHDLEFVRARFTRKTNEYSDSIVVHHNMNTDDLFVDNINLKLNLLANINKPDVSLHLNSISFMPNYSTFNLRELSGDFHVSNSFVDVKNFRMNTDSSDIALDARLEDINLFDSLNLADFKEYPLKLNLQAYPFCFDDLSAFLEDLYFLKGSPEVSLSAEGTFGNLTINELNLTLGNTELNLYGNISNLHTPEYLLLDVASDESEIDYADVLDLLPFFELPQFEDLKMQNLVMRFKGEPTNFFASVDSEIKDGKLAINTYLNLQPEESVYNCEFTTSKLNLKPLIGVSSEITSSGAIKGESFALERMKSIFNINSVNSFINGYKIDSLKLDVTSHDKLVDLICDTKINNAVAKIEGELNLQNESKPIYNLVSDVRNLNLAEFVRGDNYNSNLNFLLSANGESLEIDSMRGIYKLKLVDSYIGTKSIDSTSIELKLNRVNDYRNVQLNSNIVDLNFSGKFSLRDAIELISYQAGAITEIISSKIDELNPVAMLYSEPEIPKIEVTEIDEIIKNNLDIDFEFEFKNFELIAELIGEDDIGITGRGSGSIQNTEANFRVNSDIKLNHFYILRDTSIIYLSDLETNINFSRNNSSNSFENLFGALSVSCERAEAGTTVKNLAADIIFNQNKLFFNLSSNIDDLLNSEVEGSMVMKPYSQILNFEKLKLDYKNLSWENKSPITLKLFSDSLRIENLDLYNGETLFSVNGLISGVSNQDLYLSLRQLPVSIIDEYLELNTQDKLTSLSNLNCHLSGSLSRPIIEASFDVNDISLKETKFGSLIGNIFYKNNLAEGRIIFLDDSASHVSPSLNFNASVPVKISLTGKSELIKNNNVSANLIANGFKVGAAANLIPGIRNPKGTMNGKISASGALENLVYDGYMRISNASLTSLENNLSYDLSAKMLFENDRLKLDSLYVSNSKNTDNRGTLRGKGDVLLNGFSVESANISLNGDLLVLSEKSKEVSPSVYGALMIESDGDWKFKYENEKSFFKGKILLKNAKLIFSPEQSTYARNNNEFVYIFKVDSSKLDMQEIKFQKLISQKKLDNGRAENNTQTVPNFDYKITISAENSATLEFILSQAFNQKLSVSVIGDLVFESKNGVALTQGQLNLQEDSKLEFFKTLSAEGSIRFDADVTDPFIDVIAIYSGEYLNSADETATPIPVEVRIKINSIFSALGQTLSNNPDNILVYLGARNIDNDTPDKQYDAVDAISFILIGKFASDFLSDRDREVASQSITSQTATSFLGPALTSFVNSKVGDVINNISLSPSGQKTRFNVSGKIQNVRYSLGGTEEVFTNISEANLKIEYLFNPNFLIRVERKDPIVGANAVEEKINEVGLKYRFIF
ncbi:MAG: hypothetical protein KJ799_04810 [Bacteroidetes bacterium]|nr:hypothetical protein [Bacteroidota bacterium]